MKFKNQTILILGVITLLLLAACGSETVASLAKTKGTVHMIFRDMQGEVIDSVRVTVIGQNNSVMSNEFGVATIPNLTVGTHQVRVVKGGFQRMIIAVHVNVNAALSEIPLVEDNAYHVTLHPLAASIKGYVKRAIDGNRYPLDSVKLFLEFEELDGEVGNVVSWEPLVRELTTDASGAYEFETMPVGVRFRVRVPELTLRDTTYGPHLSGWFNGLALNEERWLDDAILGLKMHPFSLDRTNAATIAATDAVTLVFSAPLNATHISADSVTLRQSGNALSAEVATGTQPNHITVKPISGTWIKDASYQISYIVHSKGGMRLASTVNFTVPKGADTVVE